MNDTSKYLKLQITKSGIVNFSCVAIILVFTYIPAPFTSILQGVIFVMQIAYNRDIVADIVRQIFGMIKNFQIRKIEK